MVQPVLKGVIIVDVKSGSRILKGVLRFCMQKGNKESTCQPVAWPVTLRPGLLIHRTIGEGKFYDSRVCGGGLWSHMRNLLELPVNRGDDIFLKRITVSSWGKEHLKLLSAVESVTSSLFTNSWYLPISWCFVITASEKAASNSIFHHPTPQLAPS